MLEERASAKQELLKKARETVAKENERIQGKIIKILIVVCRLYLLLYGLTYL